jgi:hypothetical protein
MLKLLSVTAVASVIMTATLVSPVTAAQINVNTGHFNSVAEAAKLEQVAGTLPGASRIL